MSIETNCTSRLSVTSFVLTCIALLTMRLAIAESIEATATEVLGADAGAGRVSLMLLRAGSGSAAAAGIPGPTRESGVDDGSSEASGGGTSSPASDFEAGAAPDFIGESSVPLESTRWRAIELEGTAIPSVADARREPHLVLDGEGRFAGSDGCNRVTGSYQVNDDAITFTQAASTQMACFDSGETERQFHAALDDARSYRIVDQSLELAGVAGTLVARFEAHDAGGSAAAPANGGSELGGTSWQLLRFEGGDDTTLTPDDPTKYTLEFAAGGSLVARVDCNRGRGTWESSSAGQLTFGPLALTRAMCPPGSMHDQVVRQLGFVRSYVLKDGHLFLALMADGGIYEFEPAAGN
jgi:heat shock protein HslJ